ncbi:hypothetical protein PENTCL1PPCAC_12323, partial [Pristionchus entomophagus]
CSAMEPARATTLMQIVFGAGIGGTLLIFIVIVICCLVWRCKRRVKDASETKKGTTRSASEYAQTPTKGKCVVGSTPSAVTSPRPPPPPSPFKPKEPKGAAAAEISPNHEESKTGSTGSQK